VTLTDTVTDARASRSRGAALVVGVAGFLILLGSFMTWGTCSTTPCGGNLQSISEYSGLDLGFGAVTAVAGLALAAIGLDALRRRGASHVARAAVPLALLVVVTAGVSVTWMYIVPGDDKDFYPPPYVASLVGILGVIAFAASLRLRHAKSVRTGSGVRD
jgi:hypothetical protein